MAKLQLRRHEQILQRMISRVVSRTELSDLADSAAMKHVLSAVAREMDDAYYQLTRLLDIFTIDRAAGDDLDERAKEIQPGTLQRLGARRAIGLVVFSRNVNTGTTVIIETGTSLKTADGRIATTTQQAQITNTSVEQIAGHGVGRDSNLVSATMDEAGTDGNVAPNTVIKFLAKPPDVDEVTNPGAFTQGRGEESDDAFRDRLRSFVNSLARCTPEALKFISIGVQDPTVGSDKEVVFAHTFEDPVDRGNVIEYVDDGAGTIETTDVVLPAAEIVIAAALGGEEFLNLDNKPIKVEVEPAIRKNAAALTRGVDYFLNPASGRLFFTTPLTAGDTIDAGYTYFTGLIAEVQKVIDGDPNDRANFPGWRAAGVVVRVLPPTVVQISVTATLNILDGFDRNVVIADVETAISSYINQLGISGDVIRHEIVERAMAVPGVFDINLSIPSDNIVILDDEVARITSGTLDVT